MNRESAFPYSHTYPRGQTSFADGMTLRDYFAIRFAMNRTPRADNGKLIAEEAYAMADAMLEARKKTVRSARL